MDSVLKNGLDKYLQNNYSSFHMPGHGGKSPVLGIFGDILKYDLTELDGTGNLFDEEGDISKSEQNAAKLYESAKTLYSTGGCTLPIQTMLRLTLGSGDKILVARNAHKSVINTIALLGAEPVWMDGDGDKMPLFGRIKSQTVATHLKSDGKIKAVFVTSPDYYGVISDIGGISKICLQFGIPLLVDAAHGSHLKFCDNSLDPIASGATMAAYSSHKTLPVLTGGAMLHIADEKYADKARSAMRLFCSTSPSYLIMLSLDICIKWLSENGEQTYKALAQKCESIRAVARKCGFDFPQGETDPCRLTFLTKAKCITGLEFADHLRSCGIECEFADEYSAVLLPPHFLSNESTELLSDAIKSTKDGSHEFSMAVLPEAAKEISPGKVLSLDTERISVDDSVGRIAAEPVCICPPCIPLVSYGEKISYEIVKYLKKCSIFDILVVK